MITTRLLSLIWLLQSRPSWKAGELAAELKVSERTVHRYIRSLEEMGIPICSERGPYGGFSLLRGYKLPPLLFTAEEATVLYMGARLVGEVWGQTYQDAATAATAKLDNVLPDELRRDVARAEQTLVIGGLSRMDYSPWQGTIHLLRRCIVEQRPVALEYKGFRLQITERVVDPYGLTFQWGLWYLVGLCHLREEMRTFRVDRIQGARAADGHFELPAGFSVRAHLEHTMNWEPQYTVEVELDARVAARVREQSGHWMEFAERPDGSLLARFGATELDWPTGWVLRHGAAARVIYPPELLERVRQAAAGILGRYENPGG